MVKSIESRAPKRRAHPLALDQFTLSRNSLAEVEGTQMQQLGMIVTLNARHLKVKSVLTQRGVQGFVGKNVSPFIP